MELKGRTCDMPDVLSTLVMDNVDSKLDATTASAGRKQIIRVRQPVTGACTSYQSCRHQATVQNAVSCLPSL